MALRYDLNESALNLRPGSANLPSWASRDPVNVNYDKSTDVRSAAQEALRHSVVDILAPVGVGKSTLLPRAIAAESNLLVFMVVPSQLMAVQIYDYVTSHPVLSKDGVKSYLCEDASKVPPSSGVMYLNGASIMDMIMRQRGAHILKGQIVFMDEAQESDCYTYVLRNLSTQMGAKHLIRASSTIDLGRMIASRDDYEVSVEREYDARDTPQTWDLADPSKPWYYKQQGNTLILTDCEEEAQVLLEKYEQRGYNAFRLTSKTTVDKFRNVLASLETSRLTVLIADYTYRSGFTFNVTNVIDTSRVHYKCSIPGVDDTSVRLANCSEVIQAKGRVGRIPGSLGVYSRADVPVLRKRTRLAAVEAEAAAYLYRLLGYEPTRCLARRVMAKMDLPLDVTVVEAFNGLKPLTCYNLIKVPPDKPLAYADNHLHDFVDGEFYYAPCMSEGVELRRCDKFPEGYKSVSEFLKVSEGTESVGALTYDERLYAVAVSLRKYNENVLRAAAMKSALAEVRHDLGPDESGTRFEPLAKRIEGDIVHIGTQRALQFADICKLVIGSIKLECCEGVYDLILERARLYYDAYITSAKAVSANAVLPTYQEATVAEAGLISRGSRLCSISDVYGDTTDDSTESTSSSDESVTSESSSSSSEEESSTSSESSSSSDVIETRILKKPRARHKLVQSDIGRISRIRVKVPISFRWHDFLKHLLRRRR